MRSTRAPAMRAKAESPIQVYPGTRHGVPADYRDVYDEAAAKNGWAHEALLRRARRGAVSQAAR
jgi:hypothetical protein